MFQYLLSSDGPSDLTLLDEPMLFRGFAHDLQRFLIDNADELSMSPAAVEILKKAFTGEDSFDFTQSRGKLSVSDLVALVSSEAMNNVKTANVSGFDSATDLKTVATILKQLRLDSLVLRPASSTPEACLVLE
ncbi:hypothetical protein F5883DRAFT_653443 [Diaporthe sp. PMI_573]|nr:hypothetical protein F5883DRAFT_653443 [Diaporthaceae sp. PMI_573]